MKKLNLLIIVNVRNCDLDTIKFMSIFDVDYFLISSIYSIFSPNNVLSKLSIPNKCVNEVYAVHLNMI